MHNAPGLTLNRLHVRGVTLPPHVGVFAILAMVNEFTHLNMLEQVGHASHVISVVVGNQYMINACDTRIFHRSLNALPISAASVRPTGVNHHGRFRWRNDQRRLSTIDINGVNQQLLRRLALRIVLGFDWL